MSDNEGDVAVADAGTGAGAGADVDAPARAGAGGEEVEADVDTEAGAPKSALAENITRKGSNSYYYAHASSMHRAAALSYDGPPIKLGTELLATPPLPVPITKFSWCDNKKNVKVYIELEGAEALSEDCFDVAWTGVSVTFTVTRGPSVQRFHVPVLYDSISHAALSRRADRCTLTLSKALELPWIELTKKKVLK